MRRTHTQFQLSVSIKVLSFSRFPSDYHQLSRCSVLLMPFFTHRSNHVCVYCTFINVFICLFICLFAWLATHTISMPMLILFCLFFFSIFLSLSLALSFLFSMHDTHHRNKQPQTEEDKQWHLMSKHSRKTENKITFITQLYQLLSLRNGRKHTFTQSLARLLAKKGVKIKLSVWKIEKKMATKILESD